MQRKRGKRKGNDLSKNPYIVMGKYKSSNRAQKIRYTTSNYTEKRRKTLNEIKIIEIFIKMEKKNIFKMKILDLINLFVILSPKIVKM